MSVLKCTKRDQNLALESAPGFLVVFGTVLRAGWHWPSVQGCSSSPTCSITLDMSPLSGSQLQRVPRACKGL